MLPSVGKVHTSGPHHLSIMGLPSMHGGCQNSTCDFTTPPGCSAYPYLLSYTPEYLRYSQDTWTRVSGDLVLETNTHPPVSVGGPVWLQVAHSWSGVEVE